MIDKNDVFTSPLLTARPVGRPRKPNALTPAERAKIYRKNKADGKVGGRPVAVLFARADSIYKSFEGCDVWDMERDALAWPGGCPVVAHPPCRSWGSLSFFARPRLGEKELALWAVDQVRKHGGVLEHPKASKLWAAANLPAVGQEPDRWGGWTLPIAQFWFGHEAEKQTFLYIVGCDKPPPLPIVSGRAPKVICSGQRNPDGSRVKKGDALWRPKVSLADREHTPELLARWLVQLARQCRPKNAQ